MLLLLKEHGDPSFLFPNLSSYNINNQLAKFEKNLRVGSIAMFPVTSLTGHEGLFISVVGKNTTWLNVSY